MSLSLSYKTPSLKIFVEFVQNTAKLIHAFSGSGLYVFYNSILPESEVFLKSILDRCEVKVYTVPGQVRHDATRKAVLTRADGIAFIADSQISESANNVESFENLEKNLALVGIDIEKIPLVIQFNKRDLKDIVSEDEIHRTWEPTGIPVFMASALYGQGVIETFKRLVELTYDYIDTRYSLKEKHMLTKEMFVDNLTKTVNSF